MRQALLQALNVRPPFPMPGFIRVYDPRQLVMSGMMTQEEAEAWTTPNHFIEAEHPGWCEIAGCPQAKQINGSLICRYHADLLTIKTDPI